MAASTEFAFRHCRDEFVKVLHTSLRENSSKACISYVETYPGSDIDKKGVLDQAFRDVQKEMIAQSTGCEVYKMLVRFGVEAAMQDICPASIPFLLLSDTFDMITLDQCEEVFNLVEESVNTWKSAMFYEAGKNYLLRMCNDLLRRLSKSQNTVFCGRIQLFLSRLFPLSEKSALNLMSQFNLENVTVYNKKPESPLKAKVKSEHGEDKDEVMDFEEGEMDDFSGTVPIDYNLYRKFWALQDYFRKPTQCYEKFAWKTFTSNATEVLNAFASSKLDDVKSSRKKLDHPRQSGASSFFAKYLTSEKLLDLQLNDSNFRRYVLVQFLILFQYLNIPVKFKGASAVLTDEQTQWILNTQDMVYKLIRETPPDGSSFASNVEHMLAREENWNSWKNEGCPSFEREVPKDVPKIKQRPKRRKVGDNLQAGGKVIKMGSAELTRLWNLAPGNMDACGSEKRVFLPTLEDFFDGAMEQSDPEAMVEEEYKCVNDQNFQWKALRLLARRSPHFFTHTNTPAIPLPKYLEVMLSKLAKEMPPPVAEEMKTEVGEEEEGIKEAQDEDDLKQNHVQDKQEDVEPIDTALTKHQIQALADCLGSDWKKLASELSFPEDDISYFETDNADDITRAATMLTIWQENDLERATVDTLKIALKEIGLIEAAAGVFGTSSSS